MLHFCLLFGCGKKWHYLGFSQHEYHNFAWKVADVKNVEGKVPSGNVLQISLSHPTLPSLSGSSYFPRFQMFELKGQNIITPIHGPSVNMPLELDTRYSLNYPDEATSPM